MRKRIFFIVIFSLLISFQSIAQLINVNPDANGSPCLVNTSTIMSPEYVQFVNSLPVLDISDTRVLPDKVDNSESPYMRKIFKHQSYSSLSGNFISYVYTYEVNRLFTSSADIEENQYTYNFQHNVSKHHMFLNEGLYGIIVSSMQSGVPDVTTWDPINHELYIDEIKLLEGHDEYYKSLEKCKLNGVYTLDADNLSGNKLYNIKRYLYDHGNDGETGGILFMTCFFPDNYAPLPSVNGSNSGKACIVERLETSPLLPQVCNLWVNKLASF